MTGQTDAQVQTVDRCVREQCCHRLEPLTTWYHDRDTLARRRQQAVRIDEELIELRPCLDSGRPYQSRHCGVMGYPQLTHCRTAVSASAPASLTRSRGVRMDERLLSIVEPLCHSGLHGRAGVVATWVAGPDRRVCAPGQQALPCGRLRSRSASPRATARYPMVPGPGWLAGIAFAAKCEALGSHLTLMAGTSTWTLRHLDRPLTLADRPHRGLSWAVASRVLDFQKGLSARHWVGANTAKADDEQNNFRVEDTISSPSMFRG